MSRRPSFAVDWDGTCVEDAWPEMGEWRPGAIDALHELTKLGHVVIHTCRIAPMEFHDMNVPRPVAAVWEEVNGIRRMLDDAGLHTVEIWQRPFKPPAAEYIDNRARRYTGRNRSWAVLVEQMQALYGNPALNGVLAGQMTLDELKEAE